MLATLFKNIFSNRHDYDEEDLSIIRGNFPAVKIENVPTAWIMPIDSFLLISNENVKSIKEEQGFPLISWKDKLSDIDKRAVQTIHRRIRAVDVDMHIALENQSMFV
jgi:hypothetical protein